MDSMRFFTLVPFHTDSFGMGTIRSTEAYIQDIQQHAVWADEHNFYGTVLYNFNHSLDPLLTAQIVLASTKHVRPMVAIQPAHMHPFALMRALATLVYLYNRGIDLNIVAGASSHDRHTIGDHLSEEARHERLREYISAIRVLSSGTTTFRGEYFELNELNIQPAIPAHQQPQIYVPGSSPASCQTVQTLAHSSLLMAKPIALIKDEIKRLNGDRKDLRHGMIVGIIARRTSEEAWNAVADLAHQDRRTRITNRLFISRSSSYQHRVNLELADQQEIFDQHLWYGSAKLGIDAPKLVGSYTEVSEALQRYQESGITDILFDLPEHLSDYEHLWLALQPLIS